MIEALSKAEIRRIDGEAEYDRYRGGCRFRGQRRRQSRRGDHRDLGRDEVSGEVRKALIIAGAKSIGERDILSLEQILPGEPLANAGDDAGLRPLILAAE